MKRNKYDNDMMNPDYVAGREMYQTGIGDMPATMAGSRGMSLPESEVDTRISDMDEEMRRRRRPRVAPGEQLSRMYSGAPGTM